MVWILMQTIRTNVAAFFYRKSKRTFTISTNCTAMRSRGETLKHLTFSSQIYFLLLVGHIPHRDYVASDITIQIKMDCLLVLQFLCPITPQYMKNTLLKNKSCLIERKVSIISAWSSTGSQTWA